MNVFDFDNTLYNGESSVDFTFYLMKRNKRIILYIPLIFTYLIRYKLCLTDRIKLEETLNHYISVFFTDEKEMLELTQSFWKKYGSRLNKDIISLVKPDDLIISAGPDFLLNAVKERLGTDNLITSVVDLKSKRIVYFNFKDNKVKRFRERYGDTGIKNFYTDSYNDRAMMDISDNVILVKNGKPVTAD